MPPPSLSSKKKENRSEDISNTKKGFAESRRLTRFAPSGPLPHHCVLLAGSRCFPHKLPSREGEEVVRGGRCQYFQSATGESTYFCSLPKENNQAGRMFGISSDPRLCRVARRGQRQRTHAATAAASTGPASARAASTGAADSTGAEDSTGDGGGSLDGGLKGRACRPASPAIPRHPMGAALADAPGDIFAVTWRCGVGNGAGGRGWTIIVDRG